MKGKKVLKVLMATMVIVTMLAQVSVFAETSPYFTTSTVYDATTGKAKVTSTVYGIDDGEEITFLVENNTEILYIDQVNENHEGQATEGTATFTYLIDAEDANSTATVKFASTSNPLFFFTCTAFERLQHQINSCCFLVTHPLTHLFTDMLYTNVLTTVEYRSQRKQYS